MYNNKHHVFDAQYNHKLFAHANRWGNDVISYITELRPKVIKFLDPNLANVQLARELVPDAILVYRNWMPAQPLGNSESEAFQLGWIGGTDHLTANPIFKDVLRADGNGGTEPPIIPGDNTIELTVGGETVYKGEFRVVLVPVE